MNINIEVDSKQLQASFNRAPRVVIRRLQDWVDTTAAASERHVKQEEVPVRTGRLQSSIFQGLNMQPLTQLVKPHAEYAGWVHDGALSPHAPAKLKGSSYRGNPFMTRTFKEIKPAAERDAQQTLNRIVREI